MWRTDLLEWVSTNVNFLFGLCGTLSLVALRALLTWQADEGRVAAGFCSAALLLALSVVDEQVQVGGYAEGLAQLVLKYCQLMVAHVGESRSPLLIGGLLAAVASTFGAGSLVFTTRAGPPPSVATTTGQSAGVARGGGALSSVTNAVVVEAEELAAVSGAAEPGAEVAAAPGAGAAEAEAELMASGVAEQGGGESTGGEAQAADEGGGAGPGGDAGSTANTVGPPQ